MASTSSAWASLRIVKAAIPPASASAIAATSAHGFVLQEVNLPFADGDDLGEVLDSMVPENFAREYPHFAELTREYVLRKGYSYSDEFEFGLGLILAGLVVFAVA